MWQHFVEGNADGEEIIDVGVVEEVHSRLSHLVSDKEVQDTGEGVAPTFNLEQLEECDSLPGEMTILSRLSLNSHTATHQVICTLNKKNKYNFFFTSYFVIS